MIDVKSNLKRSNSDECRNETIDVATGGRTKTRQVRDFSFSLIVFVVNQLEQLRKKNNNNGSLQKQKRTIDMIDLLQMKFFLDLNQEELCFVVENIFFVYFWKER